MLLAERRPRAVETESLLSATLFVQLSARQESTAPPILVNASTALADAMPTTVVRLLDNTIYGVLDNAQPSWMQCAAIPMIAYMRLAVALTRLSQIG